MLQDKDAHYAIIAGDLAYADCDMTRWDSFGEMIEPLAARKALMVGPGNVRDGTCRCFAWLSKAELRSCLFPFLPSFLPSSLPSFPTSLTIPIHRSAPPPLSTTTVRLPTSTRSSGFRTRRARPAAVTATPTASPSRPSRASSSGTSCRRWGGGPHRASGPAATYPSTAATTTYATLTAHHGSLPQLSHSLTYALNSRAHRFSLRRFIRSIDESSQILLGYRQNQPIKTTITTTTKHFFTTNF